jgi:hypothetical protein
MKNLIIVAFAAFMFTSCTKEVKSLPGVTENGANTFGAKVDGNFWGPLKLGIAQTTPILEARYADDNSVFIHARNFASSPNETEMEIYLKNIKGPGVVYLNQNTGIYPNETASYAYFVRRQITPKAEWITNAQLGGVVNITKMDRVNRIISGTFEFQAASFNGNGPLNVTEGRFDVKIQ